MSRTAQSLTLTLMLYLASVFPVSAQMILVTDNDLLGQSDVIVVATVVSDTRLLGVD